MSKAGAKAAERKAREDAMAREYPPYGGREMLRTLEGMLVPGSPAAAALDAHIMELGRKGGGHG